MHIFLNHLIQLYLNNTLNLRPLTPHITSCYTVIPTKWRDDRPYDVTSQYVYLPSN